MGKQRDMYERILGSNHQRVLCPEASFSEYISTPTPVGVASSQMADTHRELSQQVLVHTVSYLSEFQAPFQSDHSDVKAIMTSSPTFVVAQSLERQVRLQLLIPFVVFS